MFGQYSGITSHNKESRPHHNDQLHPWRQQIRLHHRTYNTSHQEFVKDKDEQCSKKQFVRSWLHEIKSIRNAWAHWQTERIDYRLCSRAYDTLSLIYLGFDGNPESDLYRKIEIARKKVVVMSLKEGERKAKWAWYAFSWRFKCQKNKDNVRITLKLFLSLYLYEAYLRIIGFLSSKIIHRQIE